MSTMLSPDRTNAPGFRTVEKIKLLQATEDTLSNGTKLYSLDAGTQDVVKIEFIFFNAGIRSQQQALIATATNDMLDEGTLSRNAETIAEDLDFYGAFIESEAGADYSSFTLFSLTKYLPRTLASVSDILHKASFPEKEFGIYISNKHRKFIVNSDKVNVVARRRFAELLFGKNHPYGEQPAETDFAKVTHEQLLGFHRSHYTFDSENCVILASGKITPEVKSILNTHFGKKNDNSLLKKIPALPGISTDPQREHTIEKENAVQSAIRIGRVLFNKLHPDYAGMQVLNTLLGGYFGSRLMSNIREDKGYTYGIGSGVLSLLGSGFFVISTEVGCDVTNAALKEIYFELEKLQQEAVSEDELELVRNYMTGNILRQTDGPFALADRKKALLGYDLDYSYYDRFLNTIKTITANELQNLAQKYLAKENLTELVVGMRK